MRLLHVKTHELHEFIGDPPPYVILSHRWEKDEVSYSSLTTGQYEHLSGWWKLSSFCAKAASKHSVDYVWADVCCIDKSSSAELSEAINSMFRWYQQALCCYAYLKDVPDYDDDEPALDPADGMPQQTEFWHSEWFARGWTLQELIAARDIKFFSRGWVDIDIRFQLGGTLGGAGTPLKGGIIAERYLAARHNFRWSSVAQRMSWAADRKTTRPEDRAYSLMGLFDVSMPLLYGEGGERAFERLQLEILQRSDDETIFAWKGSRAMSGLLAKSPSDFSDCDNTVCSIRMPRKEYAMTNKGIRMEFHLSRSCKYPEGIDYWLAPLNCEAVPDWWNYGTFQSNPKSKPLAIFLAEGDDGYCRIGSVVEDPQEEDGETRTVYVRQWDLVPY